MRLVQHRTAHILSVLNTKTRNTGSSLSWSKIEAMTDDQLSKLLGDELIGMAPRASLEVIKSIEEQISKIEKTVKDRAKLRSEFKLVQTVWGVGTILGLTIMYETGEIGRFSQVGDYCSYARCVGSIRISNGKKKGKNNTKNGNRYLAWAYVEAANFASRYYPQAHRFIQRKRAKGNHTLAVKALGHKLARASYYVMRDQVEFDPQGVDEIVPVRAWMRRGTTGGVGLEPQTPDWQPSHPTNNVDSSVSVERMSPDREPERGWLKTIGPVTETSDVMPNPGLCRVDPRQDGRRLSRFVC
jgi:transposase